MTLLLITQYLRGEAGALPAAGLEQHLTACADCRARMADQMDIPRVDLGTHPRRGPSSHRQPAAETPHPRRGHRDRDALLVSAAPSLRAFLGCRALPSRSASSALAAAYGGTRGMARPLPVAPRWSRWQGRHSPTVLTSTPRTGLPTAAPYSAARLLLLRTAAFLGTSLPLTLAAGLLVPGPSLETTVWWLLPALALTALCAGRLHLGPFYWSPRSASGTCWVCAVGAGGGRAPPGAVLAPGPLLAYAAVGLAAVFVVHLHIDHLTPQRNLP